MKRIAATSTLIIGLLAWAGQSQASTYIQAYAGPTFPHDADATGSGAAGQIEFDQGIAVGAKIGGWWEARPSFGLQFDFNANLNSFHTLTAAGSTANLNSDMDVYAVTLNALARLPGGFFKPYIGAGAGYFYADVDRGTITTSLLGIPSSFQEDNDGSFGWNALGGLEMELLPEKLTAFVEYKYSQAAFEFQKLGIDVDYSVSQVYGGLTYTF